MAPTNASRPTSKSTGAAAPAATTGSGVSSISAPRHVIVLSRHRHATQRALHGRHLADALDLRLGTPHHAMTQRRHADLLDVVGHDVGASLDRGHRLAS